MHPTRAFRRRVIASWVACALVLIAGLSGAHAHGVGHACDLEPVWTAAESSSEVDFVCLSCKLASSPLEEICASATADRVEETPDGIRAHDPLLPDESTRRNDGTRGPPSSL